MTEEQEKIAQKLNNWIETCNNYGSIRSRIREIEYIDINDNEFTHFFENTKKFIGHEPNQKLKFYPEHLELNDVGIKSEDDIFKEINRNFDIESANALLKFLSDEQLKEILNKENYLYWLTDKYFHDIKDKIERRKETKRQIHEILEKLKELQIPNDLILQIWQFAFKQK